MGCRYFILFYFFIIHCSDPNVIHYKTGSDDHNYHSGLGLEISYFSNGNLDFKLIASQVQHFHTPSEKKVFSDGIKVFVFDSNLDTIATIFADSAIQKKDQDMVEMRKNVILRNSNNEQLHTENLFWIIKEGRIHTEDFVTINTQREIIMGYGFTTNQTFKNYTIHDITGTMYL